jgi:hypothetical protein
MDIEVWMEIYEKIVSDLSLSIEDDERAAGLLSQLISQNVKIDPIFTTLRQLDEKIKGKHCLVFGTSKDLESVLVMSLNEVEEWVKDDNKVLIAADGATSLLLSLEIIPDIIVTDLDGGVEDQLTCNRMGSIFVVHGHGDNMEVIRRTIPWITGKAIGSTQVRPDRYPNLINHGGFTDGDRAVVLADSFGAASIELIGFDLEEPGGKVLDGGRREDPDHCKVERKKKKLKWAREIIEMTY